MSFFPTISAVFLETIIGRLAPWFLTAAGGKLEAARDAALSMLASYDVETEEEVRLAAEIASFGLGVLEALSTSMDPDLSLNAVLRLRGSANSLHRSAHQCQRALDKLRKERRVAAAGMETQAAAAEPPHSSPSVEARPCPEIILSRQQRRAIERAAEKARRQQAEQARRDVRRAMRTPAPPVAGRVRPVREAPDSSLAA